MLFSLYFILKFNSIDKPQNFNYKFFFFFITKILSFITKQALHIIIYHKKGRIKSGRDSHKYKYCQLTKHVLQVYGPLYFLIRLLQIMQEFSPSFTQLRQQVGNHFLTANNDECPGEHIIVFLKIKPKVQFPTGLMSAPQAWKQS